jgi:Mrp family chromosome partitioning ATPase/capsular polysaccharide biosynthesis protein
VDSFGGYTHPTAIRAVRILKRGWWIILLATLAVAGAAYYQSSRQEALYSASAQVLLKYQNLASGLTGIQDLSTVYQDPQRVAQTQTQIAMSPDVANRVVEAAKIPGLTPGAFLGSANVTAATDSDILNFNVTYDDPQTAATLATIHAKEFIQHRRELDTASIVAARKELRGRITELEQSGFKESSPLVARLAENEQALRTMEALQTANASLLRPASGAAQIQPRTKRAVVLGVMLGLMLGIGLAFARDALDTRVRSATEIGDKLRTTLLARIAAPPRALRRKNRLVMIASPHSAHAEAFRMLRANLEFVNLDRGARSIMVTSALEKEGKSTTVANLAVALTRAGHKVALVDLDLRRPSIASYFGIPYLHPGVTNIVVGSSTLEEALVEVSRTAGGTDMPHVDGNGASANGSGGVLKVLASGRIPPNPGEVVKATRLTAALEELARSFDFVLNDTPPLLSVGDAMTLSANVDAMITVARLRLLRRGVLAELARALETCATIKLGVVVTGAETEAGYGYGGYDYYRSAKKAHEDEEWVTLTPPVPSPGIEEQVR